MKTSSVNIKSSTNPLWIVSGYFAALVALYFISDLALANSKDIGDISEGIASTFADVSQMIAGASYVAGVGFALAGMLKFKAHKDNPTQVPLSQPIVLLCVAAGLVFLPTIITTAGQTIFGGGQKTGGSTGGGLTSEISN